MSFLAIKVNLKQFICGAKCRKLDFNYDVARRFEMVYRWDYSHNNILFVMMRR